MASANQIPLAHALRATCMALLVFGLGLLANAPALHAWVHRAESSAHCDATQKRDASAPFTAAHNDAGCAITLFGQGTSVPEPMPEVDTPVSRDAAAVFAAPDAPSPAALAYLHPPGRAPPTRV
jgi:hypothetical protein